VREPADGAGGNGGASGTASQKRSSTDTKSSSRHSSSSTHRIRTKNGRILNPTETQKRESKELKERLVKFLQNPSEAGLGDAELFEDATFNKILPSEFENIKALKDKLGMYLLFKILPCFLLVL
jgi:phosphate starvation-inducible protein PhoH